MMNLSHPFITKMYKTFKDETSLYLLMEFVSGGELFNYIRGESALPNDTARFYAAEVILVLDYLHSKDVAYRDLKPENLLINELGHIKLVDFGFAKQIIDRSYSMCGTPEYLAPEIILSTGHDKRVDLWSLGILIFDMLAGYPPFNQEQSSKKTIFEMILNEKPEYPPHFHAQAQDLLSKLLITNPSERLGSNGMDSLKNHPWFIGLDWGGILNGTAKAYLNPQIQCEGDTHNFHIYEEDCTFEPSFQGEEDEALFGEF